MKSHLYLLLMPTLLVLSGCAFLGGTPVEELGISIDLPSEFNLVQERGNVYSGSQDNNIYLITNRQNDPLAELYEMTGAFEEGSFDDLLIKDSSDEGVAAAVLSLGDYNYELYETYENDCGGKVYDYESEDFFYIFGLCETDEKKIFCGTYPDTTGFYNKRIIEICQSVKPL